MPTPVATARQCLTEEAGRALDEAVNIAKRRKHAQTTSLHTISSLLSPSSFSLLRDSLSRVRSTAYSPRLQLRALELCVGMSLDRQPCSKSAASTTSAASTSSDKDDFIPPVSNSLMAAIKRSQAHQRRQPDMYHLSQINNNNINNNNGQLSISCIKVELKHFVLSILDDPIVSRVFGEAGFRSSDIKLAIIQPPRWASGPTGLIRPPLFLCNFTDGNYNTKRIYEVMVKNKERNPVLVGVCAKDTLVKFKENIILNKKEILLFNELINLRLVCIEKEIKEGENEGLDLKIDEVIKSTAEIKYVVNIGELGNLVDNISDEFVKRVVKKVSKMVEICGKKVWLISEVGNYETYSKFIGMFNSVEKDWDLQPLPITSSNTSSFENKSSFMGSFVPFGGFFPTPSDFRAPLTGVRQPFTRCNACNESYEKELRDTLREGSSVSVAEDQSSSLPSWLQRAESDPSKAGNVVAQVKDVSSEKLLSLQKKWDGQCRLVHQNNFPFSTPLVSLAGLQVTQPMGLQLMGSIQGSRSSSGDSSLNERACSNSISSVQMVAPNASPQKQIMKPDSPKRASENSVSHSSTLPVLKDVATDLGLGMVYTSKPEEVKSHLYPFSSSVLPNQGSFRKESKQVERMDIGDYKPLFRKLSEVVSWQNEAICKITEIVSRCKTGHGHNHGTNTRGNIWLNFLGPDKVGQKRVAQSLADAVHGSRDRLIALNLSYQDKTMLPDSVFRCQELIEFDINSSRITIVDHIAQELCRKPQSVVFLENVDEADPLVQNSLLRAIQSGKFPDSRGKEVGINNVVFVTTSRVTKEEKNQSPRKEFIKFTEEKVLGAKNWQMQLAIRSMSSDAFRSNETTVTLLPSKSAAFAKRKLSEDFDEPKQPKKPKKSLDLNLSLEMECYDCGFISDGSKAWLEDFYNQVDGNVAFKLFDFDALADRFLTKIRLKLEEALRPKLRILLEIDHEVMLQILAAAWYSGKTGAVEEWIDLVLGPNFAEAGDRYHLSDESVVRLCSCERVPVKEWASGICLPRRINLSI